jgi:hypothetical protein
MTASRRVGRPISFLGGEMAWGRGSASGRLHREPVHAAARNLGVQHSTAQYSTAQYSTAHHSTS